MRKEAEQYKINRFFSRREAPRKEGRALSRSLGIEIAGTPVMKRSWIIMSREKASSILSLLMRG